MWEIRKVYVAQMGRSRAALVSESLERVRPVVDKAIANYRAAAGADDWRNLRHPDDEPHIETWMVAVRFDGDKAAEVVGLARAPRPDEPDPLEGVEIDITRGA